MAETKGEPWGEANAIIVEYADSHVAWRQPGLRKWMPGNDNQSAVASVTHKALHLRLLTPVSRLGGSL
jgi:hypothetical protein